VLPGEEPGPTAASSRRWPWAIALGLALFGAFLLHRAGQQDSADNARLAARLLERRSTRVQAPDPAPTPPAATSGPASGHVPPPTQAAVRSVYVSPSLPVAPVTIGFESYSVDEIGSDARSLGAGDEKQALIITHVYTDGPSSRAGLRDGDVLLKVDGRVTASRQGLREILRRRRPGETIEAEFLRNGSRQHTNVVLEPMVDSLAHSCDAGDTAACFATGNRLRDGMPGAFPPDWPRAATYYERGCLAGRQDACISLGRLLRRGDDELAADPARSATLFQRACDEGVPAGCHNLGILYREGIGVARDPARARELTQQACAGGDPDACGPAGEHPE
jgi:TPR repeat protein